MMKKILSLMLAILLVFQLCCVTSYGEAFTHDIVLILDSSGSMSGQAITACKQAAKTFCDRVLSSGKGYRIGLVIFASNAKSYGFTDNTSNLYANINNMYASGGTNLHEAVLYAKNLLSGSQASHKSIVIMADGLPEHGITQSYGRYTSSDNYTYQQANAVYNLCTSLHSSYDIYTLGFFHSMNNESNRKFGIRFLKDLQNKGYYEASDAESLYAAFEKIVEILLVPPLTIKLSNVHEATYTTFEEDNSTVYDFRHLYKITASVTNTGTANADNSMIKIHPAAGMAPGPNETYEKSIGQLAPGETKTVTWKVRFEHKSGESKYQYSVVAGADNAVGAEQFQTIVVPAGIASVRFSDNEKYKFTHSADNFHNYYAIRNDDKEYLESKLSNSEKVRMLFFPSTFGGSCFGLSTVALLSKEGTLKPDLYVPGATSISQFSRPINDINVESLITFYHIMQKSDRYINSIERLNDGQNIKKIERLLKESNVPVLVVFNWTDVLAPSGHAIIACGYESTNKNNSPAGLDLNVYTKKINVYDVNSYGSSSPEIDFDIYYSSDYKKWTIPVYDTKGNWGFNIKNVTANTDDYNPYSLDDFKFVGDKKRNKDALLLSNSLTEKLIIENSTGNFVTAGATEISGNIDIWSYYDAMVLSTDDGTTYSPQTYMLPMNDDYTVKVENPSTKVELAMSYSTSTFIASADKLDSAGFKDEGEISIKGSSGEFELKSVYDEGSYSIPWHTFAVKGENSTDVSLKLDETGYILSGDNLKNITIEATGNDGTVSENISCSVDSLLISKNENGQFSYFADIDKDGKYTNDITLLINTAKNSAGGFFANIKNTFSGFINNIFKFFENLFNMFMSLFK